MDTKEKQLAASTNPADRLATGRDKLAHQPHPKRLVIGIDVDANKPFAQPQTNARTWLRAGKWWPRRPIRQQPIAAAADVLAGCLFIRNDGQRTKPQRSKRRRPLVVDTKGRRRLYGYDAAQNGTLSLNGTFSPGVGGRGAFSTTSGLMRLTMFFGSY